MTRIEELEREVALLEKVIELRRHLASYLQPYQPFPPYPSYPTCPPVWTGSGADGARCGAAIGGNGGQLSGGKS